MFAQSLPKNHLIDKRIDKKKSRIHGLGLFAKESILPGELLISLGGTLVTKSVWWSEQFNQNLQPHMPIEGGRYYLVMASWLGVNHACSPNLSISGYTNWVASKKISAGEELTTDYATFLDFPKTTYIKKCLCGDSACRTEIRLDGATNHELKVKYEMCFSPDILRKQKR